MSYRHGDIVIAAPLPRLTVEPDDGNGLKCRSQLVIDKVTTLPLARIGSKAGAASDVLMLRAIRSLAVFFGIA